MQAVQQQNQNKLAGSQLIGQGLAQTGATVGNFLQQRAAAQKQQQWVKAVNDALGPQMPQQGPQPLGTGTAPGLTPPTSGFGAPAPSMEERIRPMLAQRPELAGQLLPELFKAQAAAAKPSTQKPQGSYWLNPDDPTQLSPTAQPGWIEYKTSQADAGGKVLSAAQGALRTKAMEDRVAAWNRSIDAKQVDQIVKSTGFTPKMISSLQNTAVRGQRGLALVSDPNITWQQLHAAGVDFAGIMQGGAPHVGEIVNSTFPNWNQDVAKWSTYLNSDVPANVPTDIRLKMQDMLSHVVALDTKFIKSNNKFQKTMMGPTIQGGLNQKQSSAIDEIQGSMTGGAPKEDFSSMSDDELRRIAAGGQ